MAEINYGQLADAIVDAIQRSRATGDAADPMSILSQGISDSVDTWSRTTDNGNTEITKSINTFKKTTAVIVNQLVTTTTRLASEVLVLQRQGLAFNKDFTQTMAVAGDRISDLPGGLKESMESLFSFQSQGLMNTGKGTLALANTMRITGQSVQGLISLDKQLLNQGLIGTESRDNLITSLGKTANSYGVAAETLVGSLNNLSKSLPLLGITGGAGSMTNALKDFTAKFPALGDQMGSLVNEIVGSIQSNDFGGIQRLGLQDFAKDILEGRDVDLVALAQQAAAGTRSMTGGGIGSQGIYAVGAQMELATNMGVLGTQLEKQMALEQQRSGGKSVSQLSADFMTTLNEALAPFQKELGAAVTTLAKFAGGVIKFVASIVNAKVAVAGLGLLIGGKLILTLRRMITAIGLMRSASVANRASSAANTAAMARGAKSARGISLLGRAGIWGAAAAITVWGMPALVNVLTKSEKHAKAAKDLMEKEFESNKFRLTELGRSRFEEVSKMLINQNLLMAGSARAAFTEGQNAGFAMVADKTEAVVAAVDRFRVDTNNPSVNPRAGAAQNPGVLT